jgi:hypothetical protein
MKKNTLIEAILELNNWELIYVFEEFAKNLSEEMPEQNIALSEQTIDAMRTVLAYAIKEEVIEVPLLEKFISEAKNNAKQGQIELTSYVVTIAISLFLRKLIKHFKDKKEANVLNQILDEFKDDEER